MTADELLAKVREARARADAAAPGKWRHDVSSSEWHGQPGAKPSEGVSYQVWRQSSQDAPSAGDGWWNLVELVAGNATPRTAEFIAHARQDVPELCDIIEALVSHIAPTLRPEPPPGTMRVTASVLVTYDVTPGQIAAYLRANGWQAHECIGGTAYELDRGATIVSIKKDGAADWHDCFAHSLDLIARVEGRSTGEVLRDIAGMEEA